MSLIKATYSMVNGAPINVMDYGAMSLQIVNSTGQTFTGKF